MTDGFDVPALVSKKYTRLYLQAENRRSFFIPKFLGKF